MKKLFSESDLMPMFGLHYIFEMFYVSFGLLYGICDKLMIPSQEATED